MGLARIITRSDAYSRELTLDLLARGYAVEIVSPDKIPDNIADLELRVDAGPGDQLIASVVIRRSPEPREATRIPEEPVSFHAEPGIEDVELPAALPQLAPQTFSVAAETLHEPEFDAEEGERRISPLDTFRRGQWNHQFQARKKTQRLSRWRCGRQWCRQRGSRNRSIDLQDGSGALG